MKLLTVTETTALVNSFRREPLTEKAIYQWIYRGKIPHIKVGSATMVLESELEKFLSLPKQQSKMLAPESKP